jgi:hypothetical protein
MNQGTSSSESTEQRSQRLSVEADFIRAHPYLPCESMFAAKLRNYMAAARLEWTHDNLSRAATDVLPSYQHERRRAALLRSLRSIT